jgi:hypothetical protein
MLPLALFRSLQFVGANLTTLVVYAGLGGAIFLLILQLQLSLHYSAINAGMSLLPFTALMFAFSSRVGQLAQRIGPRIPMTVGPLVAGAGLALLGRVEPGATYVGTVLPAVLLFGAGMTLTVAPLTTAVLAAADDRHLGTASGVNNAVARVAGLIAVAVLPAIAGIGSGSTAKLASGYPTALRVTAIVCASGGVVSFLTIRRKAAIRTVPVASVVHPCTDPCVSDAQAA